MIDVTTLVPRTQYELLNQFGDIRFFFEEDPDTGNFIMCAEDYSRYSEFTREDFLLELKFKSSYGFTIRPSSSPKIIAAAITCTCTSFELLHGNPGTCPIHSKNLPTIFNLLDKPTVF